MNEKFNAALEFTLRWETGGDMTDGGYTNDPNDPGGETKWGISKRAYPNLDIANLTLDEAKLIYLNEYWKKMECEKYELKLAIILFDSAVNCGVARVSKWVQLYGTDWRSVAIARMCHYANLSPNWKRNYLNGVMNRLGDLCRKLLNL